MGEKPETEESHALDKALSVDQFLNYACDLVTVYEQEKARRRALEEANNNLRSEIADRKRAECELAESEARYRRLFEDSHDAVFLAGEDWSIIDANKAFSTLLKTYPGAEPNLRLSDFFTHTDDAAALREQLLIGSPIKDREITLTAGDGRRIDCRLTLTVCESEARASPSYHGIIRDVTVGKRVEQMARQTKKMEALGAMAAGIAHEIRNPLAVASSAAQLLMGNKVPEDQRRLFAEKVIAGIERASFIIENLLALTRPLGAVEKGVVDVADVVKDALVKVESRAREAGIELDVTLSPGPAPVNANMRLLTRALINLYTHAVTAAEAGGRVFITNCVSEREVVVFVEDRKRLIPPDALEHLFDPYFSARLASDESGLGLAMTYYVVKHHGGGISAESSAERGTLFTVTLPRVEAAAASGPIDR